MTAGITPSYQRNIQFFKMYRLTPDDGRAVPFQVAQRIGELRAIYAGTDRYLRQNDRITSVIVDGEDPVKLRVLDVRRDELPQVERDGVLNQLGIPDDAGLAEQTHVVSFANGIVGADFNFHGPRITRLADFLSAKTADTVILRPLIKRDIGDELSQYRDVKLVHLRIDRSLVEPIRAVDASLADAFEAAFNVGQPGQVELVLRPKRYERRGIGRQILETARSLAGLPEIQAAGKFEIRGHREDGAIDTLDVLSEHVVFTRRIRAAGTRTRSLDSDAAYGAIMRAYEGNRDEIGGAAVMGL